MSKCDIRKTPIAVMNKTIGIEFDTRLKSRVFDLYGEETTALGNFESSHYITTREGIIDDFQFQNAACNEIDDKFGHGKEYTISGKSGDIEKILRLNVYDMFPSTVFIKAKYINAGTTGIRITGWVNSKYTISSNEQDGREFFWSFQGASYGERPDWVLPLNNGYSRKNFMGMNNSDYGGGIPLTDVWNSSIGITVGHCERDPKLVSLPVEVSDRKATISVMFEKNMIFEPGETLETVETFVMLHQGDFYDSMTEYRRIMERRGMKFAPINKEAYETTWCSWGYERNFNVKEVYDAIPMVKKLGIKWVCLDDGWQNEEGDYELSKERFPAGEDGMKEFVRKIHEQGLKVQLWWIPMACDPKSQYYAKHPDSVILDKNGNKQDITWWNNYYLCPANEDVITFTRKTVKKILGDWDFDGLKIDGQHLNAAPLCYNESHHHKNPEDSYEAVPEFFKMIYNEAKQIKPDALIMFCPCGTCCSFFTMPYFDMPVASDPESSWQVRSRGKVYKALMGSNIPYNGDHVELSDNECDFASTVGIGGVINTKFTWPVGSSPGKLRSYC
jgi:alpha-galactosidase